MMTSAQVVETSVNVTSNSPSQDYTHPDDHNLPNYNSFYYFKQIRCLPIQTFIIQSVGTQHYLKRRYGKGTSVAFVSYPELVIELKKRRMRTVILPNGFVDQEIQVNVDIVCESRSQN